MMFHRDGEELIRVAVADGDPGLIRRRAIACNTAKIVTTPNGSKTALGIRILFTISCNLALVEFERLVKHAK